MMKAFLVDDEPNVVALLKSLLNRFCPKIKVMGSAGSVKDALIKIPRQEIDILFLDVQLEDGTGMELLRQLPDLGFNIIFVTAYDQYALDAFRFSALDFILKPIDPKDLRLAVHKAEEKVHLEDYQLRLSVLEKHLQKLSVQKRKLVVNDKHHVHAIPLGDICFLQADGPYTQIHLIDGRLLSSRNLKFYENQLTDCNFERTHHSYLVNLAHFQKFEKQENVIILTNDLRVPVSSRKREYVMSKLRKYGEYD